LNYKYVIILLVFIFSIYSASALPDTGLEDWKYFREISIKELSGTVLSDYQVPLYLNSTNFNFERAKTDGSDIRFTDYSGNDIPYWIEIWDTEGKYAKMWIKIPSLAAAGQIKVKMYFGNNNASSKSDANSVFITFVDKNSYNNWIYIGSGSIYDNPTVWNILDGDLHFYSEKKYAAISYPVNPPSKYIVETIQKAKNSNYFIGFDSMSADSRIFAVAWHSMDYLNEKYRWTFAPPIPQIIYRSAVIAIPGKYYHLKIAVDEDQKTADYYLYDGTSDLLLDSSLKKPYAYGNAQHLNYISIVDGFKDVFADISTKYIFIRAYAPIEPKISISEEMAVITFFPTYSSNAIKSETPSQVQTPNPTSISVTTIPEPTTWTHTETITKGEGLTDFSPWQLYMLIIALLGLIVAVIGLIIGPGIMKDRIIALFKKHGRNKF
jgi:hypothetical protein